MDYSSVNIVTSSERNECSELSDCNCCNYAVPDSNITDWSRPVTRCVASDYSDLAANNVIYNKQTLTNDMWIELPSYAKQFLVSQVYQIQPSSDCNNPVPVCSIRHKNIWLRIPIEVMDISTGHKVYRIEFQHQRNLENMTLYFSYTIQDDQPCKPYVYMN